MHLQLWWFFTCSAIVCSEVLDHRFFLGNILEKYGQNGTITYEGFDRLYSNLGLGNSTASPENGTLQNTTVARTTMPLDDEDTTLTRLSRQIKIAHISKECTTEEELEKMVDQHNEVAARPTHSPKHCLSPRELLAVYGIAGPEGSLTPVNFLHLCPAIIYELDQGACSVRAIVADSHHQHVHGASVLLQNSAESKWFFACLMILLISVSGLLCVAVVPLLHKAFISQVVCFLVALAVGTLLGDAFMHLIPHALESHGADGGHNHTDSLMKTALIFLTVVFFFTFEAVLNIMRTKKGEHKSQNHVNYVSVNINQTEKEMMELGEDLHHEHTHSHHNHTHSHHNNVALMVIMGDGLHNMTDGLAIGAAFSGGLAPGFATALAVFTHELPHELGDFAVLLQAGVSVRRALLYNLLSSGLSLLGTIFGLVIGNFGDSTRWIYAITAGSFIYIALSNLVPEINRHRSDCGTILLRLTGVLSGGFLMGCIALFEHDIQQLFS